MPTSRRRKKKKGGKSQGGRRQRSNPNMQLKKRLESSEMFKGAEVEYGTFGVKVSELILDFGADLLEECTTEADYKKYVPFLIMCWNMANLPEEEREDSIKTMVETLNAKEIEAYIRMLVDRKVKYYGDYKYFVAEYEITMLKGGDMHLSVASMELE